MPASQDLQTRMILPHLREQAPVQTQARFHARKALPASQHLLLMEQGRGPQAGKLQGRGGSFSCALWLMTALGGMGHHIQFRD